MAESPTLPGHAFICYVHEDSDRVDQLQALLEGAGITVWRDKDSLWPGDEWKVRIREAIQKGSLAFIPCFSQNSIEREVSYQNEELNLAAEQVRLRPSGRPWLFPVRFDDVALPYFDLGASRDLNSFQMTDLFGEKYEDSKGALLISVLRIVQAHTSDFAPVASSSAVPPADPTAQTAWLRSVILVPQQRVAVDELFSGQVAKLRQRLTDHAEFPSAAPSHSYADLYPLMLNKVRAYDDATADLRALLQVGCAWALSDYNELWTRCMEQVARTSSTTTESGDKTFDRMRGYPLLPLLYAGGLAAISRNNYSVLNGLAVEPTWRENRSVGSMIGQIHPYELMLGSDKFPTILAKSDDNDLSQREVTEIHEGKIGSHYTGVSDHLNNLLRPSFETQIPDDEDYEDAFNQLEVMLSLIAQDAKLIYQDSPAYRSGAGLSSRGPWFGRFLWRRAGSEYPDERMFAELQTAGQSWPPLQAGLLGGSIERATTAFEKITEAASTSRARGGW